MFGVLCLVAYGSYIVYKICEGSANEQISRQSAFEHNIKTYRDKWGNERYTLTGIKKNDDDYRKELHNDIEKMREDFRVKQIMEEHRKENELSVIRKKYETNKIKEKYGLSFNDYVIASTNPRNIKYNPIEKYYLSILVDYPLEKVIKLRHFAKENNIN